MQKISYPWYNIFISEKSDWPYRQFDDFIVPVQIHSAKVVILDEFLQSPNMEWDAIVSWVINSKIWVFLADCNGIALLGSRYFAVIHAWRRWLYHWVIQNTIESLKSLWENPENLLAYLSPAIRGCCYEIWEEMLDYFPHEHVHFRSCKPYLDMKAMILDKLDKIWLHPDNISVHPLCTRCSDNFFSYRWWDTKARFLFWVQKIS